MGTATEFNQAITGFHNSRVDIMNDTGISYGWVVDANIPFERPDLWQALHTAVIPLRPNISGFNIFRPETSDAIIQVLANNVFYGDGFMMLAMGEDSWEFRFMPWAFLEQGINDPHSLLRDALEDTQVGNYEAAHMKELAYVLMTGHDLR